MSPEARRRMTAPERLERIYEAATRLFAERGFAATTVEDIVRAAGLTKPMLYRHFESKQELCIALLERARAELVAAPLDEFRPGVQAPEVLLPAMLDAWLAHIERHPAAARLLFSPISGDAEVERAQHEVHARQRATQIALLREFRPELDSSVREPLAEALRAGFGAVAMWWLERPQVPRSVATDALVQLARGVVSPPARD